MEHIQTPEGSAVSCSPERGGIITSLQFRGTEVLYLEQETFDDPTKNVRGGIPILFPNAGAQESSQFPLLKQHGFARNSSDWEFERTENGFRESLRSSEATRTVYPYDFRLTLRGEFADDGSFVIEEEVENTARVALPLAMGLHPYFRVPNDQKKDIQFNFMGGEIIEAHRSDWENGTLVCIDAPSTPVEVVIPELGTLVITASPEFKKIWVWSLPGKDFICVEPMMREVGGLVSNPELIAPQALLRSRVSFSLR